MSASQPQRVATTRRPARARGRYARFALTAGALLLALPARADDTSAPQPAAPVLRLPCARAFHTLVVPVRINDSQVLHCILDTGMPEGVFIMDPAKLAGSGVEFAIAARLNGVGPGSAAGKIAYGTTVHLADLEIPNQRVIVLDEPGPLARIGFDGAIGASVFQAYVVQMDCAQNTVTLYAPDSYAPPAATTAVPLTLANTRPFVAATVRIGDGAPVPVELMVDTGATKSLSLNPTEIVAAPRGAVETMLSSGVGGDNQGLLGRIRELQVGPFTLVDVLSEFPKAPDADRGGTIGMDLLQRFTVTLDYPHERMLLAPTQRVSAPFRANMSGISLWPNDAGELYVRFVLADSPADQAGVRVGDVVRSINGKTWPATELSAVREMFRQPGATVRMELERAGATLEVHFELKPLV
ncbi:MAG: aspartyl protease family protein [Phycisphaerales bacterium]|nr:aspartyl protease family protein [Phycisphaerales bacterium]